MKYLSLVFLLICLVVFTGCAIGYFAPVIPPTGGLVSIISAPLDTDAENTKLGSKEGESSCHNILGLVAFGDCSVYSAARDGGLTTVNHIDYKYLNILCIYQCFTTVAYGE